MNPTAEPKKPDRLLIWSSIGLVGAGILLPLGWDWYQKRPTAAQRAVQRAEFLESNGAPANDICKARRAVQEAYADAADAEHYREAKLFADVSCRAAELRGEGL